MTILFFCSSICSPKFSVFLFGGDFDDPGLVDDPGGAVALLHDPDDPGLVSFLFLNVLKRLKFFTLMQILSSFY